MPITARCIAHACLMAMSLALAGCGGSGATTKSERFVYTSTADCGEGGQITPDDCSNAADKALGIHDQQAPKYPTMRDCEAAENVDRCERVADRHYRPRLMGYLYTTGKQVTAVPLYSGQKGVNVYRDVAGTTYDWERTEGVKFSKEAIRKAEGFVPSKKRG